MLRISLLLRRALSQPLRVTEKQCISGTPKWIPKRFVSIFVTSGSSIVRPPVTADGAAFATTQSASVRHYAKAKDKKKDKKNAPAKVAINDEQLGSMIDLPALRTQMEKSLAVMREDYIKNLSLRSTTGSIETLRISFEGKDYQLQELAQVVRKNPKTIVVNLVSFPQTIPAVLQAIQRSGMNLNPQQDGTTLFIPVPKVTREHREGLAKNAKVLFIKCRDRIKDAQNQSIKKLKKQSNTSEDEAYQAQQQITQIADGFIKEAEKMMESKQAELLGD